MAENDEVETKSGTAGQAKKREQPAGPMAMDREPPDAAANRAQARQDALRPTRRPPGPPRQGAPPGFAMADLAPPPPPSVEETECEEPSEAEDEGTPPPGGTQ